MSSSSETPSINPNSSDSEEASRSSICEHNIPAHAPLENHYHPRNNPCTDHDANHDHSGFSGFIPLEFLPSFTGSIPTDIPHTIEVFLLSWLLLHTRLDGDGLHNLSWGQCEVDQDALIRATCEHDLDTHKILGCQSQTLQDALLRIDESFGRASQRHALCRHTPRRGKILYLQSHAEKDGEKENGKLVRAFAKAYLEYPLNL